MSPAGVPVPTTLRNMMVSVKPLSCATPTALGQIEPVIEQPAVALLDEDTHVPATLVAGSDDRHATVPEHPHVCNGNERGGLVLRERNRCGREVREQCFLGHAEGDVDDELAAHHVVAEEREHPR